MNDLKQTAPYNAFRVGRLNIMTRLDAAGEWMWPGNCARNQYAATCSQAESEGKELKKQKRIGQSIKLVLLVSIPAAWR